MINFSSVGTGAARLQNISPNPQKLAGMCAKLKCCLNYEVPVYEDASKALPSRHIALETKDATYYLFSSDPLAGTVTYSSDQSVAANLQTISTKRAHEIIAMNRRGEKPLTLEGNRVETPEIGYVHNVGQDVTRFDRKKKKNFRR
jgi:cell fate regulator YaaT (PSP1 superfamily)